MAFQLPPGLRPSAAPPPGMGAPPPGMGAPPPGLGGGGGASSPPLQISADALAAMSASALGPRCLACPVVVHEQPRRRLRRAEPHAPLETADSYTDDYYNHKYAQRRLAGGDDGGSLVAPVWVETKEHTKARAAHMSNDLKNVTQKWEEGNRVLGHVVRQDVKTARALMSVPAGLAGDDPPRPDADPQLARQWRDEREP
ncbi:macrocin-O-methyltransferase [Aureococcus anophagefferens]|nr:macrocin-O-methyltransferase [Aureococcus anophagefferens]